jgi:serine kinase of HPr protein (carbohydrate metabolism regulator)
VIVHGVIVHAGLVALRRGGAWRGALIAGASGAGKSDLMLRALEAGFRLVADDRTLVWASGGRLYGRAPERLGGLIELRGLGVLAEPALPLAEITLVVRCEAEHRPIERMPEPEDAEKVAGVLVPRLCVHALDASAPAKLGRALIRLGQGMRPS